VNTRTRRNVNEETHLDESNGGGFFAEALTAEVKAVLADETSLVGAEAAVPRVKKPSPRRQRRTHHWREPLPYFLGRENQTASWVILRVGGICAQGQGVRAACRS
jgi:hypothetical protein